MPPAVIRLAVVMYIRYPLSLWTMCLACSSHSGAREFQTYDSDFRTAKPSETGETLIRVWIDRGAKND